MSEDEMASLNPCFSGTYSRRQVQGPQDGLMSVLILVLVEHTLGEILSAEMVRRLPS